jgi:Ca2+-binding EF-hand superfamily protein
MKKYSAVFLVISFIATLVFAADDPFARMDRNRDSKISRQEYMNAARESFDRLDKNHDNALTRDELVSLNQKDQDMLMKEADINHDGRILKKEYEQFVEKQFSTLDRNRDESIDKGEWNASKPPGLILFSF